MNIQWNPSQRTPRNEDTSDVPSYIETCTKLSSEMRIQENCLYGHSYILYYRDYVQNYPLFIQENCLSMVPITQKHVQNYPLKSGYHLIQDT